MAPTFCFVYEPAPGHSEMISSFASLFVANANATPEKVVPYMTRSARSASVVPAPAVFRVDAHEIDSNNQLCLTPAASLYFGSRPCVGRCRSRLATLGGAIALGAGVARRTTGNGGTALHWGRDLGRIAGCWSASVDWRRAADHLRGGSSGLSYTTSTQSVSVKGIDSSSGYPWYGVGDFETGLRQRRLG